MEPLIVGINGSSLNKTWQEIYDALSNGIPAYLNFIGSPNNAYMLPFLSCVHINNVDYHVKYIDSTGNTVDLVAANNTDYPHGSEGDG